MSKITDQIISLIKELPEDTTSEEIEELIDFLSVKKQVLEGLEDFKQGKSYSLEEMKEIARKWKSASQKKHEDVFQLVEDKFIKLDPYIEELNNSDRIKTLSRRTLEMLKSIINNCN